MFKKRAVPADGEDIGEVVIVVDDKLGRVCAGYERALEMAQQGHWELALECRNQAREDAQ